MEFGEKLKQAREAKGITQQTLADQLYVTRQAVSRWECGARYPDLMTTKCISNILGVTIDSLLSDDEMKDFSEKSALLSSQKAAKVMTSIYSVTALCCLIHLISNVGKYVWALHEGVEANGALLPIMVLTEIMYLFIFVISATCVIKSLKKEIDAKYAGLVGMLFFGIKAAYDLIVIAITNRTVTAGMLIPFIGIAFAVIIGLFFIGKKNKLAILVYIGGVLTIIYQTVVILYQEVCFLLNGQIDYFNLTYLQSLLGLFTEIAIISLMIAQAAILERSRKLGTVLIPRANEKEGE